MFVGNENVHCETLECLRCGNIFVTYDASRMWCSKCQGQPNHFEKLTSEELQLIDFTEQDDNHE